MRFHADSFARGVVCVIALAVLSACGTTHDGRPDTAAAAANGGGADAHSAIRTHLEVASRSLAVAETVTVRVTGTNPGDTLVEIIVGCGPGLDFEVRSPDGSARYPAREQAWNCPIFDSNRLEPREVDTVLFVWGASQPGRYTLRGGLRAASGLPAASEPVTIDVR